ncbi:Neuropeptide-Like Protein [Caenorhabditis elegans]|uniref:Neuropeptide-Like Protein n=1 Tax=Caenorhabditis elegans TaxID=6239 RepID=Q8MNX6_CAEEL|nr:Neuropeptide-Like Protein [Caenorhabditis elegans]CCD61367.1 Neuropeptide-Like Protein [Caenorhabditis elegans]|eukprot:NP_741520.1 Neuropeptide-Like Protein [Caenorhabditis elegans]
MISAKLFFIVLLLIACLLAVAEAQWGYGYRPYGYGGYGGWRRPYYRPWGYRPYGYGWGK